MENCSHFSFKEANLPNYLPFENREKHTVLYNVFSHPLHEKHRAKGHVHNSRNQQTKLKLDQSLIRKCLLMKYKVALIEFDNRKR